MLQVSHEHCQMSPQMRKVSVRGGLVSWVKSAKLHAVEGIVTIMVHGRVGLNIQGMPDVLTSISIPLSKSVLICTDACYCGSKSLPCSWHWSDHGGHVIMQHFFRVMSQHGGPSMTVAAVKP